MQKNGFYNAFLEQKRFKTTCTNTKSNCKQWTCCYTYLAPLEIRFPAIREDKGHT